MIHHHIVSLQAKANARRTRLEKIADWLTETFGTMGFLIFNLLFFVVWIGLNVAPLPGIAKFDPYPFSLLTMLLSLEAIALAIIVLMSQNRAARIADIREEIDLQMDVITEREITKLLEIAKHLAEHHGMNLSEDKILQEMLKQIDVNKLEKVVEKQIQ